MGSEVAHVTRNSDTTFNVKRSKVNLQGVGAYCGGLPHSLFILYNVILAGAAMKRYNVTSMLQCGHRQSSLGSCTCTRAAFWSALDGRPERVLSVHGCLRRSTCKTPAFLSLKQWSNCKIRARGPLSPPFPFPLPFLFPHPFLPLPFPFPSPPVPPLRSRPLKSS